MIRFKESKLLGKDGVISFNTSSLIPTTHLVRIIEEIVEQLDLSPIISTYSTVGQHGLCPKMLLCVIFYGYSEGIRSGAALAQSCKRDIHYIYLSNGLQPSKTVFNDFRRTHHAYFEVLFKQQIQLFQKLDFLDLSEGHTDGTTLRANASSKRVKTKAGYEKCLLTLKQDIEELTKQVQQQEIPITQALHLQEKLEQKIGQIQAIIPVFEQSELVDKPDAKLNFTDIDAPFMKGKKGQIAPHYNAQVMVDANQFIIHAHVSKNANDLKEVKTCLETCKANTGQYPDKNNLDSGYMSFANIEYLDQNKIEAFIPDKDYAKDLEKQPFHINNFQYLLDQDAYRCPAGNILTFQRMDRTRGRDRKRYYNNDNQCQPCAFREQCTTAKKRTIARDIAQPLKDKMKQKLDANRDFYNKRRFMIEPVFGHLKHNLGFTQFSLRGLPKVNAELLLFAIAWNCCKLAKLILSKTTLKAALKRLFYSKNKRSSAFEKTADSFSDYFKELLKLIAQIVINYYTYQFLSIKSENSFPSSLFKSG